MCENKHKPVCGNKHIPVCGDKHIPVCGDKHIPVCGNKHITVYGDEHTIVTTLCTLFGFHAKLSLAQPHWQQNIYKLLDLYYTFVG